MPDQEVLDHKSNAAISLVSDYRGDIYSPESPI